MPEGDRPIVIIQSGENDGSFITDPGAEIWDLWRNTVTIATQAPSNEISGAAQYFTMMPITDYQVWII